MPTAPEKHLVNLKLKISRYFLLIYLLKSVRTWSFANVSGHVMIPSWHILSGDLETIHTLVGWNNNPLMNFQSSY